MDDAGDLVISTAGGELRQHRPIVYQESDGGRRQIAGRYQLRGGEVRFALGRYDRSQPLVIDPALTWATYMLPSLSGVNSSLAQASAVALDSAGNVYLTGTVLIGTVTSGYNACFIAKLNSTGTTAAFVTIVGDSYGNSDGNAIAVDAAGNIYLAGDTTSPYFYADTGSIAEFDHAEISGQRGFASSRGIWGTIKQKDWLRVGLINNDERFASRWERSLSMPPQ